MLTLNKMANKPLVVVDLAHDSAAETRGARVVDAMQEFLANQKERIFLVMDMRDLPIGVDTMIQNMNFVSHQSALFAHPMLREAVVLTNDKMIKMAMAGLKSKAFGGLEVKVFESMDDVVKYVDSQPANA